MKHNYSRPTIEIKSWLVSKSDIKKIYDFLIRKYPKSKLNFSLEVESGNNREYDSFSEFEDDLDEIKNLKEIVKTISLGSSDYDDFSRTHIWISISFIYSSADFHIVGEDKDGTKKDFIDGSYEEMLRIVSSMVIHDPKLLAAFNKKFAVKYAKMNVVEDFWGEKLESLKKETNENHTPTSFGFKKPWYEKPTGIILIGVVIVLVGGYLLRIFGLS